jgi:CRISPR system Cascade subunit CasA
VIDEIVDDHVSMAVVLLHRQDRRYAEQAVAAVADADLAVNTLGDLATNLARAAGIETEVPRSTARDLAYGLFEAPYRSWLARLADTDDPYVRRTDWQQQVYETALRLGDRLMAAAGDAAWQGRTMQLKHGTEWLNSALADKWFRTALHKGLGLRRLRRQRREPAGLPALPGRQAAARRLQTRHQPRPGQARRHPERPVG